MKTSGTGGMPPKMKWGLILAAIIVGTIVLAVVVWKIKVRFQAFKSAQENKSEQNALEATGMALSYSPNEYQGMANKLEVAMDGWGTDEDAIMEVFERVKNDLDFLELDSAFGNRDGWNMIEWLQGDLSGYWMDKINNTLNSNGCTKRV
jgi:hypothetical protein